MEEGNGREGEIGHVPHVQQDRALEPVREGQAKMTSDIAVAVVVVVVRNSTGIVCALSCCPPALSCLTS